MLPMSGIYLCFTLQKTICFALRADDERSHRPGDETMDVRKTTIEHPVGSAGFTCM